MHVPTSCTRSIPWRPSAPDCPVLPRYRSPASCTRSIPWRPRVTDCSVLLRHRSQAMHVLTAWTRLTLHAAHRRRMKDCSMEVQDCSIERLSAVETAVGFSATTDRRTTTSTGTAAWAQGSALCWRRPRPAREPIGQAPRGQSVSISQSVSTSPWPLPFAIEECEIASTAIGRLHRLLAKSNARACIRALLSALLRNGRSGTNRFKPMRKSHSYRRQSAKCSNRPNAGHVLLALLACLSDSLASWESCVFSLAH
jgi:hypothetical protein